MLAVFQLINHFSIPVYLTLFKNKNKSSVKKPMLVSPLKENKTKETKKTKPTLLYKTCPNTLSVQTLFYSSYLQMNTSLCSYLERNQVIRSNHQPKHFLCLEQWLYWFVSEQAHHSIWSVTIYLKWLKVTMTFFLWAV